MVTYASATSTRSTTTPAACLQREVAARESHGGEARIRAARFPARKALEDFDFDHQRSLKRPVDGRVANLAVLSDAGSGESQRRSPLSLGDLVPSTCHQDRPGRADCWRHLMAAEWLFTCDFTRRVAQ
ncbi:ATP-binding protein [Microbispora sp. NBC_01389]|uniref:ATP-binding protein n=1 Tax=Microbispora sp. NBC_01389 TaxID=2903584 RepID=UPI003868FAC8